MLTPDRSTLEDPDPRVRKLMLDSNVVDVLAADPTLVAAMAAAVAAGTHRFLITHVQIDEVEAIPEDRAAHRRHLVQQLVGLPVERVPTYGVVWGVSRLDNAILGSDRHAEAFEAMTRGRPRHAEDALVVLSAAWYWSGVVSEDRDIRRMGTLVGVEHLGVDDLRDRLGSP